MKNIIKLLSGIFFLTVFLTSCKKEENRVFFDGGTPPVLTASSLADLVLAHADATNTAVVFSWTNPNYQFTTGISSQDVFYTLQFDTTGSNFTNPTVGEKGISKDLATSLTVKDLNTILFKVGLIENIPYNVEVRLKSTLANSSVPLYSNVLKMVVTRYLDVAVTLPSDLPTPGSNNGDLFLVGDATGGGWNNPVPVPTQKFTRTSSTTYEITVPLTGGKEYLFLPKNGDWGHKYAVKNKTLAGLNTGGDFAADVSDNFPGPEKTGNYKIEVDFLTGKFKVTPQ